MTIDGPVMLTCSGRYISPLFPHDWEPDIDEIAHALSNLCRFTGHTTSFYSVAEHSCRVADLLPEGLKLSGLLHDASEAYLGDLASPLKHHPFFGEAHRSAERALMTRIEETFGVDCDTDLVHWADRRLLATEKRDLLPDVPGEWLILRGVKPLRSRIVPWSAERARAAFLNVFDDCTVRAAA